MALRLVKTEYGMIAGVPAGDNNITVFKSVPYAAPPIGERRWKAPAALESWDGIYEAFRFRPIAAQAEEVHPFYSQEFYSYREEMSEDCLYLNIWTPAQSEEEKLPVMMFIHGGGYQSGYSYEITIDGEAFAKKGVILVSIDYRLGALGFLAHEELSAETAYDGSGNWGTLDQIAALKWIRRNIKSFGGDPERITIFGQSAGAMSVLNLLTSPLTDGDFVGAIMESAGGYSTEETQALPMLSRKEAEQVGKEFLALLGVDNICQARSIPWEKIVEVQSEYCRSGFLFSPVVDGYSQVMKTYQAIDAGLFKEVPCIIGTTAHENGEERYCQRQKKEDFEETCKRKFGVLAKQFFEICGYEMNPEKAIDEGGLSDMLQPPILAWCEKQIKMSRTMPNWLYYFNRELPGNRPAGAYHSSELWYVFQTVHRCHRPLTGLDYELATAMNTYWCNFAKTGDPNGAGLPIWDAYTQDSRAGLELGERIGMIEYPGSARSRFAADMILGRIDNSNYGMDSQQ